MNNTLYISILLTLILGLFSCNNEPNLIEMGCVDAPLQAQFDAEYAADGTIKEENYKIKINEL